MTEEMKAIVSSWQALTNEQRIKLVTMFEKEIRDALVEADIAYVEERMDAWDQLD